MVGDGPAEPATGLLATFRPGSRLAGYLLEQQIGAGGMAVVFRAVDQRLRRLVALKILAPGLAADQAFRQRFVNESRAAAAVDDPHILPVYEAGEAEGVLFIAMRLVPGKDVRTLLHEQGTLPPGRAAAIISQVASALDAAHAAGLVHRDVKPANMLIDRRDGRPDHVYLSDFGISKRALSMGLTGAGEFLGTPNYIAPEQINGRAVDGRTDQYALACGAFELLAGKPPFERDQDMAVVWAQLSEPPPPLGSLRPGLPETVDNVFARALAKDPQYRFPSCQEFADALRAALGLASGPPDPQLLPPGQARPLAGDQALRETLPPAAGIARGRDNGRGAPTRPAGPRPGEKATRPGKPRRRISRGVILLGLLALLAVIGVAIGLGNALLSSGPAGSNQTQGRSGQTSPSAGAVLFQGQITLNGTGINLDAIPPVTNTNNSTLSFSGGSLSASGPASFAAWTASSSPSYSRCHTWAQTNGTNQLQLQNGMNLCVLTGNGNTAFLRNITLSSDGSSATAQATIWGNGARQSASPAAQGNPTRQFHGQIALNGAGINLDSSPPVTNTSNSTLTFGSGTLTANSPASIAIWTGASTPSYSRCRLWAQTNGTNQLQLQNGMNLCVLTGNGHTAFLGRITLSSDGSSATAQATIWGNGPAHSASPPANAALQYRGQIALNGTGINLDSSPPVTNTSTPTLTFGGGTLTANGKAAFAVWTGRSSPSFGQCRLWAQTNGTTQLQLTTGMNLCVLTGNGHTAFLGRITLSSDGSSATAAATIWAG